MKKTLGGAVMALAIAFGIIATTSTTVNAQWSNRGGYGNNNGQQMQQGFQYGVNTGATDAQARKSYSPERSRYYRNASTQAFRNGFVRGYDQGYRQYASNNNGGYRNDGYYGNGRNDGYYGNGRNDGYYGNGNGNGGYGNGGYGNGGYGNGGYNDQELNAGYQQGINTGASDGQSNKSYDPQRSRYYKNARTQAFRDGFVRGYDQGYRQYSGNGGYRRSNGNGAATAATILGQILGRP